jgi:beta-phosphoglucomutase-like phosphatase (HAD superfamily)
VVVFFGLDGVVTDGAAPPRRHAHSAAQRLGFRIAVTYILSMSLRLRKRPPSGIEMINAGKPWSPMDMEDLFDFHD